LTKGNANNPAAAALHGETEIKTMLERLQVISDPVRFTILTLLKDEEMAAGHIASHFPQMTRPAVSQHLRILKDQGLLWERRHGTRRLYRLRRKALYDVYQFLELSF